MLSSQIYQELGSQLWSFIFSHVKNRDESDDIFQEVFIKINNKLTTLKDENKLTSWVYQITRNTIIDHMRRREPVLSDDALSDLTYIEEESDEMLAHGLRLLIEMLPEKYREVLILTNYHGMKYAEVAQELGIPLSTVKTRVSRARQEYKQKILEFCHIELDAFGGVVDYEVKGECSICKKKN